MIVLTHGPPQVMTSATYGQEHLGQVPLVARPGPSTPELIGIGLAERAAPLPNGFKRDDHPASEQEFFHIAVAQAETDVQPDARADDLGWKAVVLVSINPWCALEANIAH